MGYCMHGGRGFFLVALRQEQRLPGMAVFILAQALWAIRLLRMEGGRRALLHGISWLLMAGALAVVSVIIARGVDAVLLLTAVYGAFLLTTTVFAWVGRENLLFTLGMSLFVCCDMFVAANCAGSYMDTGALPLVEQMNGIPFNMMWAFTAPARCFWPSVPGMAGREKHKKGFRKTDFGTSFICENAEIKDGGRIRFMRRQRV